jgi:5-methylcytosine-specific restriction enzyme A
MTAKLSNPAAAKEPRRVWYGTQLWKNRRAHQLRIEPLCVICKAEGRITGATIADHFPAHRGDYNAFVLGPLRSLCAACHDNLQGFNTAAIAWPLAPTAIRSIPVIHGIAARSEGRGDGVAVDHRSHGPSPLVRNHGRGA